MKTGLALLFTSLAFVLGASPISAATISWTSHNLTPNASDISTTGILIDACNGATFDQMVNGLTFKSQQPYLRGTLAFLINNSSPTSLIP